MINKGPVRIWEKAECSLDILGVDPRPHVVRSQELEGGEEVEGEDGGPAEEEEDHDQDQHVDHLSFQHQTKQDYKICF